MTDKEGILCRQPSGRWAIICTIAAIVLVGLAAFPSIAHADCYVLSGPTFADRVRAAGEAMQGAHPSNLDSAHAHDCQMVKRLIDCGMQERCRQHGRHPPRDRQVRVCQGEAVEPGQNVEGK